MQHWVEIIPENSKIFILIDKKELENEIINKICFKNEKVYFIKSNRSMRFRNWMKKIKLKENWQNVGLAHLTTFWHSQKYNFKNFWNIDADDTLMCIDKNKAQNLFSEVKKYAEENEIDIFSQDFYYSREPEFPHWSFGVSYTRNKFKLEDYLNADYNYWLNGFKWKGVMNLDCYFNYLKEYMPGLKLKAFNPKNILFCHGNGLCWFSVGCASFMQYKEDRVEYPVFQKFYDTDKIGIGYVPRNKNAVLIDADINEDEGIKWLYNNIVKKDNNEYWLRVMNK